MRVLVLGGTGCVGSRTAEFLRSGGEFQVGTASSTGAGATHRLDLNDESTWGPADDYDAIIDGADSLAAPPDGFALRCLEGGQLFLETSADGDAIERLHTLRRTHPEPAGTLVLGAGLFPGVSNVLARRVHEGKSACERLEVAIRYSPLSMAGVGVCRLMAHSLGRSSVNYHDGKVQSGAPVRLGPVLPFADGRHPTLEVGLPESRMLHWSLGVPTTGTYLSPVPFGPVLPVRMALALTPWPIFRARPVRALATHSFALLRRRLLARRVSRIELTAIADRGTDRERHETVEVPDGMRGTAAAAAAALLVAIRCPPARGVHLIDEVAPADALLAGMEELGFPTVGGGEGIVV